MARTHAQGPQARKAKPKGSPRRASSAAKKKASKPNIRSKKLSTLPLSTALLRNIYELMLKSRVLEERLIKIYKVGDAYFWIGGPGEEAFGVPLGLLAKKGQGHQHDWFHLHYRATPTLMALGLDPADAIRLIMNRATDVSTGGRNFSGHYCYPQWNVAPITSPIEVQYSIAIGTAWAQHRRKAKGITIVSGGDAGSAEGDFASCLIWASRPGNELPMLITVQNNQWGISTNYSTQHGEKYIADRGKAFGMRTAMVNGNDPIESYLKLQEEMSYIRKTGKPVLLETFVSRLYGHSSASGANFAKNEEDCLRSFEEKLLKHGVLKSNETDTLRASLEEEYRLLAEKIRSEPLPTAESIWEDVYVDNENADWRKF